MRSTLRLATLILTVGVVAASTGGDVVINMPPPPREDAGTSTATGQQVDVGLLALARYSQARRGPRDTYLSRPYADDTYRYRHSYYGFGFPFGVHHLHFGFHGFGWW